MYSAISLVPWEWLVKPVDREASPRGGRGKGLRTPSRRLTDRPAFTGYFKQTTRTISFSSPWARAQVTRRNGALGLRLPAEGEIGDLDSV